MAAINRDTVIAVFLLLFSSVLYAATYDIRTLMMDESMGPALWPRIVIGFLGVLSLIYLVQSVRSHPTGRAAATETPQLTAGWFINPVACIVTFAIFLLILPYLGLFISGAIFVFALLTILGSWSWRSVVVNLVIAVVFIGANWVIFTHLLRMYLPQGTLLRFF